MAEKDASARLRRAVRGASACCLPSRLTSLTCGFAENNLFLVKRLIKRTDMRNPDPYNKRYTSLALAAVLGHEETFEFLLSSGHDDHEYSKVRTIRYSYSHPQLGLTICLACRTPTTTLSFSYSLVPVLPHRRRILMAHPNKSS